MVVLTDGPWLCSQGSLLMKIRGPYGGDRNQTLGGYLQGKHPAWCTVSLTLDFHILYRVSRFTLSILNTDHLIIKKAVFVSLKVTNRKGKSFSIYCKIIKF